jgi:hypothetical protein
MPKLGTDLEQHNIVGNSYGYSATGMGDLGASEYTLASIAVDKSGSVYGFVKELEDAVKKVVQSCQFSPRADNLMLRLTAFDDVLEEVHGFKLLEKCNTSDYDGFIHIGGTTALYDAAANSVSAALDYAGQLWNGQDIKSNAICFFVTDGQDNASKFTPTMVKDELAKAVSSETVESIVSVLIGVNVTEPSVAASLKQFQADAGITQYVNVGQADPKSLAKLAEFVSKSISAQSAALGTGGPSQSLTF